MRIKTILALTVAALMPCGAWAQVGSSGVDLAARLTAGSPIDRTLAVDEFLRLAPEKRSPSLWPILAAELTALNDEAARRRGLLMSGAKVERYSEADGFGTYQGRLVEALSQWDQPDAIPALIGAIETGNRVVQALVRFGDAAVSPVATLALSDDAPIEQRSSAVYCLQRMVESGQSLSGTSRARIRDVASHHLTTSRYWALVMYAAELAIATKDPTLRGQVVALVSTPTSLAARLDGGPDQQTMARTRIMRALDR